ncbi:MAG: cell division protein SepF [Clostridia bacterium]|nr:cell division protein SepF [Clostridia bacterium]
MGIFRNRQDYDNFERDNFGREDNNFDRMYDSRDYSRNEEVRRFDERSSGGYSRQNDYNSQDNYRYNNDPARPYESLPRDYRENRYSRYDERPVNDNYYPRNAEPPRGNFTKDSENQVVFCTPKSYEDIQKLIDSLKKKQSLIVDVTGLDSKDTQRYLDFLSGAIYALNGSYQKIDNKKFYFAPQGVSITIPYDLRQRKEDK